MARVTNIISTIDDNVSESVTVDSVSWSTDSGTITLSATVPAAVNVGDVIDDSSGNGYLITGISGADLTCQDWDTTTDPATGSATIREAYSTITLWEADLDAGTNTEAYKASDTAEGRMFDAADYDESVTVNGGSTIGLASVLLTVEENARHTGTANTGARMLFSFGRQIYISASVATVVEWLEFDCNDKSATSNVLVIDAADGSTSHTIANFLLHDMNDTGGILICNVTEPGHLINSIMYDCATSTTGSGSIRWFYGQGGVGHVQRSLNNTFYKLVNDSGTGFAIGVGTDDNTSNKGAQNTICVSTSGSSSGVHEAFSLAGNRLDSFNMDDDTTLQDDNNQRGVTVADQFESTVDGSEDLRLKTGSDGIDNGTDLGTTPTGVNIDILGRDRDAEADTWDIGAHELVSGGGGPVPSKPPSGLALLGVGV